MANIEIIHHFKPESSNAKGGLGVLAIHEHGNSFVEITTMPCSEQDQYSKKTAVTMLKTAREQGHFIRVPLTKDLNRRMTNHRDIRDLVINMFYPYQ